MKDFFISYNDTDRHWAEWIAWQLEAEGSTTILQAWDFPVGGNFVLEMDRGVQEAERALVVLSPAFLAASFTAPEWAAFWARDPKSAGRRVLPVRVLDCKIQGLLASILYIDLVGRDEEEARAALLSGIRDGRAKPAVAPSFPGARAGEAPKFPGAIPQRRPELSAELRKALESQLPTVREGAVRELAPFLRGSDSGLAEAARQALEKAREDDSRRVAAAAAEILTDAPAASSAHLFWIWGSLAIVAAVIAMSFFLGRNGRPPRKGAGHFTRSRTHVGPVAELRVPPLHYWPSDRNCSIVLPTAVPS